MAEAIIRQWHLAVLRAQLDLSDRVPRVATQMVGYPDGEPRVLWSQHHPLAAFGLPEHGHPERLVLPEDLVEQVVASLRHDLASETALWLRLAPPYGYLGAAPWEDVLVRHIDRPLLRVPDRLPVAADFGDAWTAAIAVHAKPGTTWAAPYLNSLLASLRDHVGGALEVHVFADPETTRGLRNAMPSASSSDAWLHLHDPAHASAAGQSREASRVRLETVLPRSMPTQPPPTPGRAWADWIADGLAGHAVRSLHVVVDADFDGDQPELVVSTDPNTTADPQHCAFVPLDDLLRFTDSIGAATLSIGSPPDNLSDTATRMLVDQIGQARPGATIHSTIAADPDGTAIAAMHAYLADRTGEKPLPWDASFFAYVQPEYLRSSLAEEWPAVVAGATSAGDDRLPGSVEPTDYRPVDAEVRYKAVAEVPSWIAASHRYLGNEYARLARLPDPADKAVVRQAYDRGAAEALEELRSIIDRHTEP